MESRTYYYARVSSTSQKLDSQWDAFKALGASDRDIITDKASGKDLNRPGYLALKNTILREGDTLVIARLDRLARTKELIKDELKFFRDHKIRVKVLDLPTTMTDFPEGQEWISDMANNILIEVLSTIAQRERENLRTRQRAGIDSARQRNVKFGRPSMKKPDNWITVYNDWRHKNITSENAIELTGLKRSSFYKLADEQLLEDAINDVKAGKQVTTSYIQREYWVGFIKASEVYNKLVSNGLIEEKK